MPSGSVRRPARRARKYTPDPIGSHALYNETRLRFSPDGKSILLFMKGDRGRDEAWLMPYPPDAVAPAEARAAEPAELWRHAHVRLDARQPPRGALHSRHRPRRPPQLWLADLASGQRTALTSGTTRARRSPSRPTAASIVFTEVTGSFDVVSVDLERATAERLIATERTESMPAWAAKEHALVYVTDRDGPCEIWLRDHAGDRPIVTHRDFPAGTTQWFMGPALSPDGARVVYSRLEFQGGSDLWMSSVAGGAPVRVTNDANSVRISGLLVARRRHCSSTSPSTTARWT